MRVLLEIAVDCVPDALAAVCAGGADRLEVCTSLGLGGLSATPGMVRAIRAASRVPIAAMSRPRGGGFAHDDTAWREHLRDAEALLEAGADAIVFGALTAGGEIDPRRCAEMVRLAHHRRAVFHRAFDLCDDATGAVERLADAGVARILSAGMSAAETAGVLGLGPRTSTVDPLDKRCGRLAALGRIAAGRIEVIGCGGVRATNASEFVSRSGLSQVHSAARVGTPAEFSADEVRRLRSVLSLARA